MEDRLVPFTGRSSIFCEITWFILDYNDWKIVARI